MQNTPTTTRNARMPGALVAVSVFGLLLLALSTVAQTAKPTSQSSSSATPAAPAGKTQKAPATTAKPGQSSATAARTATPLTLKTQKEKASYSVGLGLGRNLKKDGVDVDPAIVSRGLRDGLAGGKTLITDDEVRATMTTLQADVRKR